MTKVLVIKGARASVSMCARESVFIRPNIKLWTLMRSMCPVAFPLPFLIAAGTHNRPGQGASRLTHDALTPLPLPPFEAAQHHYLMAQRSISNSFTPSQNGIQNLPPCATRMDRVPAHRWGAGLTWLERIGNQCVVKGHACGAAARIGLCEGKH